MREVIISEREEGQRLDRYLEKYMPDAPKSFFYKMMRKKNIVLNGKKVSGSERIQTGDQIKLFLADETIDGFRSGKKAQEVDLGAQHLSQAKRPTNGAQHLSQAKRPTNGARQMPQAKRPTNGAQQMPQAKRLEKGARQGKIELQQGHYDRNFRRCKLSMRMLSFWWLISRLECYPKKRTEMTGRSLNRLQIIWQIMLLMTRFVRESVIVWTEILPA